MKRSKRSQRPARASQAKQTPQRQQDAAPQGLVRRARLHQSIRRPGFDFTFSMRRLVIDMTQRMPQLAHIDMDHVAVAIVQARVNSTHGIYASLTPMRFEKGAKFTIRRGRKYAVQALFDEHGREMRYILSFYLPRFMDLDCSEKMITIFHELWHISPQFDGDIRRHPGRCYAHSSSQKEYDAQMAVLAKKYLKMRPPKELYQFLENDFRELYQRQGGVYGVMIQRPKLLPLPG